MITIIVTEIKHTFGHLYIYNIEMRPEYVFRRQESVVNAEMAEE